MSKANRKLHLHWRKPLRTRSKICIAVSSRKRLVDAFLMHSENESLVVFAKFASEDAQIDAILKYRSSKNFVLMASMSDISLSSRSVSLDGKSKVIALLLDVILEDTGWLSNTIPILWLCAAV